jgi:hypothetical protein
LPTGPDEDGFDCGFEPGVRVADDQLHAVETAGLEPAQERGPERAVFAVADVEAEHLTPPVTGYPGGDDNGLGQHTMVDAGFAVSRIQEDVAKRLLTQRPISERGALDVELGADPRYVGLGDPAVGAESLDQVVELAGTGAVQIRLHDHREQRLVHRPILVESLDR